MKRREYLILGIITVIIVVLPFLLLKSDFMGVDAQIGDVIKNISPDFAEKEYFFTPNLSGEMETFLFSLQSGIGGLVIGYVLGYFRGKKVA